MKQGDVLQSLRPLIGQRWHANSPRGASAVVLVEDVRPYEKLDWDDSDVGIFTDISPSGSHVFGLIGAFGWRVSSCRVDSVIWINDNLLEITGRAAPSGTLETVRFEREEPCQS